MLNTTKIPKTIHGCNTELMIPFKTYSRQSFKILLNNGGGVAHHDHSCLLLLLVTTHIEWQLRNKQVLNFTASEMFVF